MATVYSLIAWGGRTGKTVTLTIASPCVVTSTNHGLRDGTGLRFKSNGDTLPTGLTSGVTYYAKSTAANTFNLYSDAGLTTIINTSGTQSGTHILQSLLVADPSNALTPYGLSDLSRWGSSGSERIYDSVSSWASSRTAAATAFDPEVGEIGEAFTAYDGSTITIGMKCPSTLLETRINGIRTPAFHQGEYADQGFVMLGSVVSGGGLYLSGGNTTIDGFTINAVGTTSCVNFAGISTAAINIIAKGTGRGFNLAAPDVKVQYCIAKSCSHGFYVNAFISGQHLENNIAVGNTVGFSNDASSGRCYVYNNISVGNTTNWATSTLSADPLLAGASNNAGLTGEAWITTGGTRVTIATTDFADYAGNDFRPASISSPQVDSGIAFYGARSTDISNAEAPNYNNGGAEAYDIGAYEFDHGYGTHPASTSVTFQGVVAGSEIRVFNSSGAEIAGIESCATDQVLTWTIPDPAAVEIKIINFAYKIKVFTYTSSVGNQTIPVQMEADRWAYNP